MLKSGLTLLSLFVLLCSAAAPAAAQSNYATLSGTVFGPQRQAVPGANVRATNAATRAARQVTTNEQGAFQLTGHLFGGRRFDTGDGSRTNLFVALVTFGDGWHNHHHYPPSARHGFYSASSSLHRRYGTAVVS